VPLVYESGTPGIVRIFSASSQPIHHTLDVAHFVGNPSADILAVAAMYVRLRLVLAYTVTMM